MPLVKCILTELDGTTKHTYYPLGGVVKLEGNKKPDTLDVVFPMQNKVKENYEISYIQDVVDTTYLRAVYPMQLSCLDESGNEQDPTDPAETRFIKITSGKYKGHYALDFNATSQNVDVNVVDKIDISKQFDIDIWFTPDPTQFISGSNEPILWSFYDGTNGLELGISNQTDGVWRAFIREARGFASAYRGTNETVMTGEPVHLRLKRDQDNVLRVFVNGIEDSWQTSGGTPWDGVASGSYQPTGVPMVFGNGRGTNDHYKGYIHEIKVYCGNVLTEDQADKIRWTKPIVSYMKFAGRIRKISSNQTTTKAVCQSNSFRFTKAKLGGDGSSLVSTALSTAFKTLLQSAVDVVDNTFTVRNLDAFAHNVEVFALTGNIYEVGSFMSFASTLLLYADCVMYMTPRKNIIIETKSTLNPSAGHITDYIFDQNGTNVKYHIKNSEVNDLKLVNEVILTGKSPAVNQRSNATPTSGIIRTLRRNILSIDVSNNLNELAVKTRLDLQGDLVNDLSPTKYVIQTIAPIHHVRFNHVVNIKRKNATNDSITFSPPVSNTDLDEDIIVRQVELHYPSGQTVIKVGENDIDYYDDVVQTAQTEDGLIDNTL